MSRAPGVPTCGHPDRRVKSHGRCVNCDRRARYKPTGRPTGRPRAIESHALSGAEKAARWRERHPEQAALNDRRTQLGLYGLTVDEYDHLFAEQGGRCAICGMTSERRLAVDHDHSCCPGQRSCGACVRGLLCFRCNSGLGNFGDDIEALASAMTYLRKDG